MFPVKTLLWVGNLDFKNQLYIGKINFKSAYENISITREGVNM